MGLKLEMLWAHLIHACRSCEAILRKSDDTRSKNWMGSLGS